MYNFIPMIRDKAKSHGRILVAGFVGGVAMNLTMVLTFRLIGFGVNGGGFLLNPSIQSQIVIHGDLDFPFWYPLNPH